LNKTVTKDLILAKSHLQAPEFDGYWTRSIGLLIPRDSTHRFLETTSELFREISEVQEMMAFVAIEM
ncbi:MAG: hypothetical protein AAF361_12155, partial [Bacteroidota bacterium]